MKTQFIFPIALLMLLFTQCKKDPTNTPDPMPEGLTFEEVIETGGGFPDPTIESEIISQSTYEEETDTATYLCTTETLSIEDAAGGSSGFPLFSPNSSVIYPGNLLQGNSLEDATPDIIAVDRAGGVISTDVNDGNIQSSFEVEEVSKSTVTDAINQIINSSTGVVPANFSFQYHNIQSRQQFALEAGVNIDSRFYDLEANLSFSTDKEYNRY
ncbi:MAG: thiol-activated cytolysin family protein, partial [Bacteroidota bacterium]